MDATPILGKDTCVSLNFIKRINSIQADDDIFTGLGCLKNYEYKLDIVKNPSFEIKQAEIIKLLPSRSVVVRLNGKDYRRNTFFIRKMSSTTKSIPSDEEEAIIPVYYHEDTTPDIPEQIPDTPQVAGPEIQQNPGVPVATNEPYPIILTPASKQVPFPVRLTAAVQDQDEFYDARGASFNASSELEDTIIEQDSEAEMSSSTELETPSNSEAETTEKITSTPYVTRSGRRTKPVKNFNL